MGNLAIPVQVLTIIGLATVVGGTHSMFVPVSVALESKGFKIPGSDSTGASRDPSPDAGDADLPETAAGDVAPDAPPADNTDGTHAGDTSGNKIDLALAHELHQRAMMGEPIWFLDARREDDFTAGHIAGALWMMHTRVSSGDGLDELAAFSSPELGDLLVIYCTGGDCQASEDTAILLEQAGYGNMAIMEAGYDDWVAAGYPTEGP
jgi:rhodanese-related sulfurtransferase